MIRYDVKQASKLIEKEDLSPLHAYAYQHVIAKLKEAGYLLEQECALELVKQLFKSVESGSFLYRLSMQEYEGCGQLFQGFRAKERLPLVFEENALYLKRYWRLEQSIKVAIERYLLPRLTAASVLALANEQQQALLQSWRARENAGKLSADAMSDQLFNAGKIILQSDFLILSGGPGSGKTYSLARLLLLLNELALLQDKYLNVLISAPTAKAVARMHESIGDFTSFKQCTFTLHTLHKALGAKPQGGYRHTQENRWQYDLVIIDEASMMDAFLFRQVLLAMPEACKLVLLGDVDQLPSVAIGAMLDELTNEAASKRLGANTIFLQGSRRSNQQILGVAQAFLHSKSQEIWAHYESKTAKESVEFGALEAYEMQRFYAWVMQQYDEIAVVGSKSFGEYAADSCLTNEQLALLEQLFSRYENFAVISPTHNGAYGVEAINQQVSGLFGQKMRHAMSADESLYHGMPIVLTVNQPALELSNGDRGVVVKAGEQLFVVFRRGHNNYQFYYPGALLAYESAYAITVHKSQGSEYRKVAVVLPQEAQRLLGPRLLYTAITRAKDKVWLLADKPQLEKSLEGALERRASQIERVWRQENE